MAQHVAIYSNCTYSRYLGRVPALPSQPKSSLSSSSCWVPINWSGHLRSNPFAIPDLNISFVCVGGGGNHANMIPIYGVVLF